MLKYWYIIAIFLILLSSCSTSITDEMLQSYKDENKREELIEIQKSLDGKEEHSWQELHNLGYITYTIWELWEGWIIWLTESLEYFRESFRIWEDKRTKHNIELLEDLLNRLLRAQDQHQEEEYLENKQTWTKEEENQNDTDQDNSPNGEESTSEESETNTQNWQSDDVQPPSEPIFRELWFDSEQELLEELERYTNEILERQDRNMQELRIQDNSFGNPIEEFFYRWNPFFQDIPWQWEKDW